jgi:hypothetical protein
MPIVWLDALFAADRAYYAQGSVHRIILAGIAHRFEIGSFPPVRITPDAPSYRALRDINPQAVEDDGTIVFRTEGMAALLPIENAQPTFYSISGPVKRVSEYTGELFGARVWEIRTTVARLGPGNDRDFDLSIFVSAYVLGDKPLPRPGDGVTAAIRCRAESGGRT